MEMAVFVLKYHACPVLGRPAISPRLLVKLLVKAGLGEECVQKMACASRSWMPERWSYPGEQSHQAESWSTVAPTLPGPVGMPGRMSSVGSVLGSTVAVWRTKARDSCSCKWMQ